MDERYDYQQQLEERERREKEELEHRRKWNAYWRQWVNNETTKELSHAEDR